jgi:uncharacterized protein YjbJ (UPF0337 family)
VETTKKQDQDQVDRLTDDDLDVIAGQKDQLIGKIHERYGLKERRSPEASLGVERHAG